MIGIDIVKADRFKKINKNFPKRFLHKLELDEFDKITNSEEKNIYLAKMWAIKEAIYKADNSFVEYSKINIVTEKGKPTHSQFHISISHEDNIVVAVVLRKAV